ncbi:MAG: DUF1385 domain-containing protein [Lachnospiraceae bacterium]|nr:DUF1385 domain-containing protein [Lachnospiraceae bacterium]
MGRSSGIGGQAVLEGIMMKNKDKYAIAVRKPDNEIEVSVKKYSNVGRIKLFTLPFIRGVFNFVDSLVLGIKSLTYSASFYEDEPSEKEKVGDTVSKKVFKEKAESVIMGCTVFVSIVISVLLFFMLPLALSTLVQKWFNINSTVLVAIIDGFFRILIFIIYIALISLMKDIQRTFMYHGAEHKCINCIETGLDLTVENVRISSKEHKRCGTSFLIFVMVISVIVFITISAILPEDTNFLVSAGIRIVFIPVIASLSYEFIRLAGNTNNIIIRILSYPGLLMQKLTTKEPTDDMIEVAIAAVEAVFDWRAYQKKEAAEEVSEGEAALTENVEEYTAVEENEPVAEKVNEKVAETVVAEEKTPENIEIAKETVEATEAAKETVEKAEATESVEEQPVKKKRGRPKKQEVKQEEKQPVLEILEESATAEAVETPNEETAEVAEEVVAAEPAEEEDLFAAAENELAAEAAEVAENAKKRELFESGADTKPKKEKKEKKSIFGKKSRKSSNVRERESMVSYRIYDEDKELEELEEFVNSLEEKKDDL